MKREKVHREKTCTAVGTHSDSMASCSEESVPDEGEAKPESWGAAD